MNIFKTIKENHRTKMEADIRMMAKDTITLTDFNERLFIAYNCVPLLPIDESWTPKDIIRELNNIRNNFIDSHK